MAGKKELNERDAKLVQWLNEAHVKEAELEADLTAHITLTTKQSYKKRLQQHLKETRVHKRQVRARIKSLGGGEASTGPALPGVPDAVDEVAGKTIAAVKGQLGAARAAVTERSETHLRNAQEELREEHVEIAIYTRLEALATEVGDSDTARLAKAIRREEERMAKYLDAELKRLVKDVVKAQIPKDQRGGRSRSSGARSRKTEASRSAGGSRARAAGRGSRARAAGSGTRAKSARSGQRS